MKKDIGLKIKRLREEKNETQDTLANLLGVKRTMISHYENGANEISLDKLLILAKHYNIPLSELTGEESKVSNTNSGKTEYDLIKEMYKDIQILSNEARSALKNQIEAEKEKQVLIQKINDLEFKLGIKKASD